MVAMGKKSSKGFLLSNSFDDFKINSCTSYCPRKKLMHNLKKKKISSPRKLPTTPLPLKKLMVHPKLSLYWDPCGRRRI